MEDNIITDKNLLKIMKESDVQQIAEFFSIGKFSEIIEIYFKKPKTDNKTPINKY